jgi:hypothetical protein
MWMMSWDLLLIANEVRPVTSTERPGHLEEGLVKALLLHARKLKKNQQLNVKFKTKQTSCSVRHLNLVSACSRVRMLIGRRARLQYRRLLMKSRPPKEQSKVEDPAIVTVKMDRCRASRSGGEKG